MFLLDVQEVNMSQETSQVWGICLMGSKYCMCGEVGVEVVRFDLGYMEGEQWKTKWGRGGRSNWF